MLLLGASLLGSPAQAGYVVTLQEVGSDVVATGSGPIDLTGLLRGVSAPSPINVPGSIQPAAGSIVTGPASLTVDDSYGFIIGPLSFGGSLVDTPADSGSGDAVGIDANFGSLFVPTGYASGGPLSDTSTYLNQTFASLGVIPGTYEWTWGDGPNQNFTLIIGAAAVPEPASAALLGTALAALLLGGAMRRRWRSEA